MLFQIYGENAGYQLLGWLLVFVGLVITNELARRSKKGGIFFFLVVPAVLTGYFKQILHQLQRYNQTTEVLMCSRLYQGI